MEEIMAIAKKHNLFVIEDNAQAIGCDYIFQMVRKRKQGLLVISGPLLFILPKIWEHLVMAEPFLPTMMNLADKMKMIANHGQSKRYYHDVVGCNSRLDTIQAAILDIKLKHLDEYIAARRKAADFYDRAFAGNKKLRIPFRAAYSHHVFHQYTLIVDGADDPDPDSYGITGMD